VIGGRFLTRDFVVVAARKSAKPISKVVTTKK